MNWPTVIGECACPREWVLPAGIPWGRCGYCGEVPVYTRPDDDFDYENGEYFDA